MIEIDKLIVAAMKEHDETKKEALRNFKAAVMNYKTQPGQKVYDEAAEIGILKKLTKQLEDSSVQFRNAGRIDLAEHEEEQLKVLQLFLPKEPADEDILEALKEFVEKNPSSKMGDRIKAIKELFPGADGKKVADIVKKNLE